MRALAEFLKRMDMTQTGLSRLSDVPVQAINDVLRGRRAGFGKERAQKLAAATHLPLEVLLGLKPTRRPKARAA